MKKTYYKLILIILVISTFPFLIRYFLINKKISFLNNIYFKSPAIITNEKKCNNYDELLEKKLDSSFSVTIIKNGSLISSHNQDKLKVPASNQKLFSSAYVLSKYKINNNLRTRLIKGRNNDYYLIGKGDPDLSYSDINKLISYIKYNKNININIVEINSKYYWPKGWTKTDKIYEYGAPITTLAIESNSKNYDNIFTLNNLIEKYLKDKYPSSNIKINNLDFNKLFYLRNTKEIYSIYSNPIVSLLTLANAESHNFTAESLFKNASNTWNKKTYDELKNWLRIKGLPTSNTNFADASGLSRENKVTTKLIALFLEKMRYSKDFMTYQSSLSVLGVRGTLANKLKDSQLAGNFFGKTGTLSNVYALSGYLYKDKEPIIISIIQNSEYIDKNKAFNLLSEIYNLEKCK